MAEEAKSTEKGYKLSMFQKAALGGFTKFLTKSGVNKVVLTPDEKEDGGLKIEFYLEPVKILTVKDYEDLRNLVDL